MCTICNASAKCDCTGGLGLTSCQCAEGTTCPICKHAPVRRTCDRAPEAAARSTVMDAGLWLACNNDI